MFVFGFLAGFFTGAILSIALLFIFASVRIARKSDDREEEESKYEKRKNEGKECSQNYNGTAG